MEKLDLLELKMAINDMIDDIPINYHDRINSLLADCMDLAELEKALGDIYYEWGIYIDPISCGPADAARRLTSGREDQYRKRRKFANIYERFPP